VSRLTKLEHYLHSNLFVFMAWCIITTLPLPYSISVFCTYIIRTARMARKWFQNNILTRASRYSTLLSNVVSFSFSTASRERHDMSVIKETDIVSFVINTKWVKIIKRILSKGPIILTNWVVKLSRFQKRPQGLRAIQTTAHWWRLAAFYRHNYEICRLCHFNNWWWKNHKIPFLH
jgi:hypothetical protein